MQGTTHQATVSLGEAALPAPLLSLHNFTLDFATDSGVLRVVEAVSFEVPQRGKVAIVGESGCGKSVTVMSLLGLIPSPPARVVAGQAMLYPDHARRHQAPTRGSRGRQAGTEPTGGHEEASAAGPSAQGGIDLLSLDAASLRRIRGGRIAMIFQDPMSALHPLMAVGRQIVESVELHQPLRGRAARERAADLLARVGFSDVRRILASYPHQLSGGMRQRAMIAMALAGGPELLIADEPTTALDPTLQRQILDLLLDLGESEGLAVLLISHDLSVVEHFADSVYVMYAGRIVEHGPTGDVIRRPMHPYTAALLDCRPTREHRAGSMPVIPGSVPDPARPPSGCRFHPRCLLTRQRAGEPSRFVVPIAAPDGENTGHVLRRCVEAFEGEPSGEPGLRSGEPSRAWACWEMSAAPEGGTVEQGTSAP